MMVWALVRSTTARALGKSSPQDPPSTGNYIPVGTRALTCANGHTLRAKGGPGGAVSC
jgi:hypothetical protein